MKRTTKAEREAMEYQKRKEIAEHRVKVMDRFHRMLSYKFSHDPYIQKMISLYPRSSAD